MKSLAHADLSSDFERHRKRLWTICYRMTGVVADADELVQETFLRALSAPPADRSRDLSPWLTRVAINAAHDRQRRRKLERYYGPWLPSPIDLDTVRDDSTPSPSARYAQHESLSYAFLLALEALSPTQRAIVVLRDVLDYSVRETADTLSLSEANVKTSHHRARASLEGYDKARTSSDPEARERARGAMTRFFAHVALGDVEGLERMLSPDVVALNDGADEFFAAKRPVLTERRVARFICRLSAKTRVIGLRICELNGLHAAVVHQVPYTEGVAPYVANLFEADEAGRISRIYSVLASRKLLGCALTR